MHWRRTLRYMTMNNIMRRIKNAFYRLFFRKNQLYYINGNDTLPAPLDPEIEEHMIDTIDKEESKCALIEHNLRLVAFIAKRFENTGANIEELISIGTLGLMKAVSTFNKDKNIKLATYASRCIPMTLRSRLLTSPTGGLLQFWRFIRSRQR